jgi:hypothetical protein
MPRVKSPETLFNLGKHFAVSNKRILRVNACARAGLQRQYVTWPLFSTRDHSGEKTQDPRSRIHPFFLPCLLRTLVP